MESRPIHDPYIKRCSRAGRTASGMNENAPNRERLCQQISQGPTSGRTRVGHIPNRFLTVLAVAQQLHDLRARLIPNGIFDFAAAARIQSPLWRGFGHSCGRRGNSVYMPIWSNPPDFSEVIDLWLGSDIHLFWEGVRFVRKKFTLPAAFRGIFCTFCQTWFSRDVSTGSWPIRALAVLGGHQSAAAIRQSRIVSYNVETYHG